MNYNKIMKRLTVLDIEDYIDELLTKKNALDGAGTPSQGK